MKSKWNPLEIARVRQAIAVKSVTEKRYAAEKKSAEIGTSRIENTSSKNTRTPSVSLEQTVVFVDLTRLYWSVTLLRWEIIPVVNISNFCINFSVKS